MTSATGEGYTPWLRKCGSTNSGATSALLFLKTQRTNYAHSWQKLLMRNSGRLLLFLGGLWMVVCDFHRKLILINRIVWNGPCEQRHSLAYTLANPSTRRTNCAQKFRTKCVQQIVLPCCYCSANQTSADCCLEVTTRGGYGMYHGLSELFPPPRAQISHKPCTLADRELKDRVRLCSLSLCLSRLTNWVTIVRANRATSKLPRGRPTGRHGAGTAGTSTVCTIPRTIARQKSEISALWPSAAKRATAVSWGIT